MLTWPKASMTPSLATMRLASDKLGAGFGKFIGH